MSGWRDLLAPSRLPPPRWTPSAALESEARSAETGAGTVPREVDWSRIRVHADADAAAVAQSYGARALTYGSDILLGAGGARDPGLLAHEATHVAQQAAAPGPALQFAPEDGPAGPGATPPREDFISDAGERGTEDRHVLFGRDAAALDAADELKLFAATQPGPVRVHVHGYASDEGPGAYSLNLSAHRAVGVRRQLLDLLPAGSTVVAFAHGSSSHFGAADANRRVGISLIGPAAGDRDARRNWLVPPSFPGAFAGSAGARPSLDPLPSLTPPSLASMPGLATPRHLMDNAAILQPSALHGAFPGEIGDASAQWDRAYLRYRYTWGLPDELKVKLLGMFEVDLGAAELANKEVANTIQAYWERERPTESEKMKRELGDTIILSPNLLPRLTGKESPR